MKVPKSVALVLALVACCALPTTAAERPPNIVFIMSDELAYYELSHMGNTRIQTPRIDQMAAEGIRFTQALAGSPVCAPLRCNLMTGKHAGHASVRANDGGTPLRADEPTIASMLKEIGYATGGFGKWGCGGRDSTGVPEKHGFDVFFGYYDQVHAHSFYPAYLIRNSEEIPLAGNEGGRSGKTYSHYAIMDEALKFIRENKDQPFSVVLGMPRTARIAPGGMVFHVLNRGVGQMRLFYKDADYEAFERYLARTLETCPMGICSYCLLPNHCHLVLWPEKDGELGAFMQKLTVTHVRNWQEHRKKVGMGHVYRGRYKSFPGETDDYFSRYVERNAYRANLVKDVDQWRWSSLWRREHGDSQQRQLLATWPLPCPRKWLSIVQDGQTAPELKAIRRSVNKGIPFGSETWVKKTAKKLGLESTMRPRGRPKKRSATK